MIGKIGYINGMRGIAILMVLAHHLMQPMVSPKAVGETSILNYLVLQPFAFNGWLGVNIFFVLSGFVLYLPYASKGDQTVDTKEFLKKRAQRLLPLYFVNVLVCLILLFGEPLFRFLAHFVIYMFALFPSPVVYFPPGNPPLWSLGIEIWFSVAFPLILILLRNRNPVMLISTLAAASIVFHGIGTGFFQIDGKYLNDFADTLPGRLSDFCIGMLAAHFWHKRHSSSRQKPSHASAMLFLGLVIIYAGLVLSVARFVGDASAFTQTIANLFVASGTALVIVALADEQKFPLVRKVLELRALQVVGMMCFSIYIWHWQILHAMNHTIGNQEWVSTPTLMLYLLILSAVSALSYRFIEFPRLAAKKIFLISK